MYMVLQVKPLLSLESKLSKTVFSFTYVWVSKGQLLLFAELKGGNSYLKRLEESLNVVRLQMSCCGGIRQRCWGYDDENIDSQ